MVAIITYVFSSLQFIKCFYIQQIFIELEWRLRPEDIVIMENLSGPEFSEFPPLVGGLSSLLATTGA